MSRALLIINEGLVINFFLHKFSNKNTIINNFNNLTQKNRILIIFVFQTLYKKYKHFQTFYFCSDSFSKRTCSINNRVKVFQRN